METNFNNTEDAQSEVVPAFKTQYDNIKAKHPDATLLFRCGDFYESYHDDAETISKVLGITLTKKGDTRTAKFLHYAIDTYLPKLIHRGLRVAICDQSEEPKKLVKRGIKEIISPSKND